MPKVSGLGLPPPSPNEQANRAGAFGGKLQTSRSHHRQAHRFGDDRAKATEPKSLLTGLKDIFLADRLDVDHTIRMKPDSG
ncbi:hypothetical protein HFN79_03845 [Rhizobium laguerreae]|nr:hypothetical protein [Rhizobium laguerreae]MBY3476978.1 hypothetical protein [Rhizobium laguerreae]MBY3504161.1 hypothetical protein [Rhizobium laguerreae]